MGRCLRWGIRGRWRGRNGSCMKIARCFVDDCYLRDFSGLECAGDWEY